MTGITRKVRERIDLVNRLLADFGTMTLRQVYYQIVHMGLNYRNVEYALHQGRLAGLIDMDRIIDRSRPSYGLNTWTEPVSCI